MFHWWVRKHRGREAACAVALGVAGVVSLASGCAGGSVRTGSAHLDRQSSTPMRQRASAASESIPSSASDPVVSDGTSTFVVTASAVSSSIVVTANSMVWSASPGQAFLVDNLTVQNPTSSPENLGAFDDPTSGLATDVDFAMSAADATTFGFASDCAADAGYPPDLCPISFAQGLTVDSNSAAQQGTPSETLAPGASARISVSYGPVSIKIPAGRVAVDFHTGAAAPVGL